MPHLNTGPNGHDQTMSAYIFRLDFPKPKIVLHRHRKLDKLMQFGGHIERNENPWQTIVHEIKEESGYDISQLKVLQPIIRVKNLDGAINHPVPFCKNTHSFPGGHFHSDDSLLFVTNEEPVNFPAKGETSDLILLSRDELDYLDNEKILKNVKQIILFAFDQFLPNWEPVDTSEYSL